MGLFCSLAGIFPVFCRLRVCLVCFLTPGRLTPQLCEEDTSQLKTRAHSLVQLY